MAVIIDHSIGCISQEHSLVWCVINFIVLNDVILGITRTASGENCPYSVARVYFPIGKSIIS